ncbi:Amino acid transporter, transmembrane family-containing protein [Strongyloides ratti]|uniref:Amino acid transporter, transmembrane family-containing protein n=1 Tax=Strongyloides ratti TaxID=34506 RepID=A0A090L661_STRRB|nr:Amino acid transporter, transmembrane family-containing protein [Strongyloides ratti]CEF63009.1 Amino acid transporter, transmembrane family-containing protein [Strongyloides ratti]
MISPVDSKKIHPFSTNICIEEKQERKNGSWYNGEFIKYSGLNWFLSTVFVIGTLAGGALVALPSAMVMSGIFPGILLTIIFGILFCYASVCMGKSWCMLQKHWSEYENFCRSPFSEMAYRASGKKFEFFATFIFYVNQFGTSVVFLLLASKNVWSLLKVFYLVDIPFCAIILILGFFSLFFILLKSPADFWGAAFLAMVSTAIVSVLIIIGSKIDYHDCASQREIPELSYTNIFLAIGIISYAYGGGASLANVQHDMKKPSEFTFSSIIGFIIIILFYVPVELITYYTYGDSLRHSVLDSMQTLVIQNIVNLCIGIHCIFAFIINLNPLMLHVEELVRIPDKCGFKRVLLRIIVLVIIVLCALLVPTFGPIMHLLGGTTMMLTSLLIPIFMYTSLKARKRLIKKDSKYLEQSPTLLETLKNSSSTDTITFIVIMIIGIIAMVFITISSIKALLTTHYAPPCFVSFFNEKTIGENYLAHTNCCGHYQNISIYKYRTGYCSTPQLDFYDNNIF